MRRKQQKKTQAFYEPPNEWSSDKRPDRPRVNFVNTDDSKGQDDGNWRTHKASKKDTPKVIKKIEEKPITEKNNSSVDIIPSMVINTRVNTVPVQNIPEKVPSFNNRKREEKKVPSKITSNFLTTYEKWPPRFRKKYCEENNISMEEIESYLVNVPSQDDHNKQHSSYQSRSQTLPPKSKGRFNESQRHHEPVFYRSNSNQPPLKTEIRRVQSTAISLTESSKRSTDFDLPAKNYNNHQEFKTADSNSIEDTENNISVNIKQSLESAITIPSGTIVSYPFYFYILFITYF